MTTHLLQPRRRQRRNRPFITPVLLSALMVATLLATVASTAARPEPAAAEALPTNLAETATFTMGSFYPSAGTEAEQTARYNDGRTNADLYASTGGAGGPGLNYLDIDLGTQANPTMLRFHQATLNPLGNSEAWVFVSDQAITSADPSVLRNAGLTSYRFDNPVSRLQTIVTEGSYRYIRVISRLDSIPFIVSEVEIIGDLAPDLLDPVRAPSNADNLSLSASATQWMGAAGQPRPDPAFAIDGDLSTSARTNERDTVTEGQFIQVDLGSTVDVGQVEIRGVNGGGCAGVPLRLVVTDDAGFAGLDLAATTGSSSLSGAFAIVGSFGNGDTTLNVDRPVRFLRVQREGCGYLSVAEIVVRPAPNAVLVEPIADQVHPIDTLVSIPVRLIADAPAAVVVKGLPRGFSYSNGVITGSGEVAGRWPVEVTALAPDGRVSTGRFNFSVTDQAPAGAVWSPPAVDVTRLSDRPTPVVHGVRGTNAGDRLSGGNPNDTTPSLDVTVWDMIHIGDHLYVGGEFSHITSKAGDVAAQAHLARFDIRTGEWDSSWTPRLDGNVHALEISPRGRLLVGGEFTSIDGVTGTSGLAAINVRTGAVDSTFAAFVERPWNPDAPAVVRELRVAGRWLYVVGKFSHINGTGGARERAFSAARVSADYGSIDSQWKPVVTGPSIWDVSPDHERNRVYLSGFFTAIDGEVQTAAGGAVDAVTGAFVTDNYFPKNAAGQLDGYGIETADGFTWVAGSEHSISTIQVDQSPLPPDGGGFNGRPFPYVWNHVSYEGGLEWGVRRYLPLEVGQSRGGDYQYAEKIGDFLFTGCHCQSNYAADGRGFHYSDVDGLYTPHKVAIVYHTNGPKAFTPAEFYPDLEGGIDGSWTATSDSLGCVWFGGDINNSGVLTGAPIFASGFARFCLEPGAVDLNLAATTEDVDQITITWQAEGDATVARYVIERDGVEVGRVAADEPLTFTDTRVDPLARYTYTVSAETAQLVQVGSASVTAVAGGPDLADPTVPANVTATVDGNDAVISWDAATDDVGLSGYLIYRGGTYVGFSDTTTYTDAGAADTTEPYRIRSVDYAQRRSELSDEAYLPGANPGDDTEAPSAPIGLLAELHAGGVDLSWEPSTDNREVSGYLVYRNGTYIGFAGAPFYADVDGADGDRYEVRAVDPAGNRSEKSDQVVAGGSDPEAPTVPADVTATLVADGVEITWTASTDNRGVNGYLVYRNGVYTGFASTTSYLDPDGSFGDSYEVRAVDFDSNRSDKSSPVVVGGADDQPPTVPAGVTAAIEPGGVRLDWQASSDDRGVNGYLVYRNNAYLAFTSDTTYLDADGQAGMSYQLRSVDVAGNRSVKSDSVTAGGPDTEAPSIPVGLQGSSNGVDIELTWDASSDNVAVTGYLVYRNDAYIGFSSTTTYTDSGPAAGRNEYQLRAVDAAENRSEKSSPVGVTR